MAISHDDAAAYARANPEEYAAIVEFWHNHVRNGLCGGEAERDRDACAKFMHQWVAAKRQHPWEKNSCAIIMRSLMEGIGKTQYMRGVAGIIGYRHAALIADPSLILSSLKLCAIELTGDFSVLRSGTPVAAEVCRGCAGVPEPVGGGSWPAGGRLSRAGCEIDAESPGASFTAVAT